MAAQSTPREVIMPRPRRHTAGLLAGTGAGLVWGLAFLVPVLLPGWSAVAVTAGRYLAYGMLSLALLAYQGRAAWRLAQQHWRAALAFAVTGNAGYYLLLVIGIQKIGAPVTDTIIGSIPVVVAVASNRRAPALPWRRLVLPATLSLAGLALINAAEFTGTHPAASAPLAARLIGLAAAVGAVALWTWYALANARFLDDRPAIPAGSWSSVVTLAALLPVALLGHMSWPAVSRRDAALFLAGIALLGVAVSWGGTWLWNTASAALPTTTAGLLINIETVSGYGYVYLARHQWPPLGQLLGFTLILAGVGLALTRRQTPGHPRQHRPPDRKPEQPDDLIPVPRGISLRPYSPQTSQGAPGNWQQPASRPGRLASRAREAGILRPTPAKRSSRQLTGPRTG
jgi:drug/metabolite transporter (DMT)-like permease